MAELEQQLRLLGNEIDWPATPELALPVLPARGRRPLWRPLLVAVAVLLVAAGVAAFVPGARSAILHWFRIGGAAVERVQTLPPAGRGSLTAGLGRPVGATAAEQALGAPVRLPQDSAGTQLYLRGGVVSALLRTGDGPVLLSEFASQSGPLLVKKLMVTSTHAEFLRVPPGGSGVWITGARHVVIEPEAPPRLAGNVLLWEAGGLTYRIEGARLDRQRALALARAVVGGG